MVGADGLDFDHETLPDIDSLWNYDGPADTERRFAKLLPRARASCGASYLAQLLTQIAPAQGLKGNIDEAHETFDEVEPLLDNLEATL
jgi:hypothetical protein